MTKQKLFLKALLGASALTMISAGSAFAQADATPAGKDVTNTFTLSYDVNGTTQDPITNDEDGERTIFTVDRVVDLTVAFTGGDTTPAPGETNADLTFTVTNEGNDTQAYALTAVDDNGDDFDPTVVSLIYLDASNNEVVYDPNNPPELAPGEVLQVIVRRNIDSGQDDGDVANITLVADTLVPANFVDPNDNSVTANPNAGDAITTSDTSNDLNAIETILTDGDSAFADDDVEDGQHTAVGTYTVASPDLSAEKTVTIFSQDGTNCTTIPGTPGTDQFSVPGACVEYRISATNSGSVAATNIDILDTLPDDLEFAAVDFTGFTAGAFNAATNSLSDGDDCDAGACVVTFENATLPAPVSPATEVVGTVIVRAYIK